jgi:hypothetical protein
MRRFGRKLKYTVLWVAAVLLSLGVLVFAVSLASYLVLLYPPVQERALRFAEEKMAGYFAGTVTVERVESNLLSNVTVYGVRAIGNSGYGDSITLGHATVRYWIPALFRKRVRVLSVRASDVNAHIVMAPGNRIQLPFLPAYMADSTYKFGGKRSGRPPNPDDWPVKVFLGRAVVDGINAVYRDLNNDMVGEIRNASARARFYAVDSFSVRLAVPQASYHSPWWDGSIDTIGASGVVTWSNLRVNSMLFSGSGTQVTGGGLLSYFPEGSWDLKADFKTPIRPVPILYAFLDDLGRDGMLSGTATFGGKLYEPLYSARVTGNGVTLRGYRLDNFSVEAAYGHDEFGRARVRGNTVFGRFDVSASILMKHLNRGPEIGDYSVSADLTGVDARNVADELDVALPFFPKDAAARLKAGGSGIAMPSSIDLSAELDGGDMVDGPLEASASVRDDRWNIAGVWGANRFDGNGRVDLMTGKLSGNVGAEIHEPSALSQTFAKEHLHGRFSVSADISGRVDNLSAAASVKGHRVRWRGMHADSLDARLTVVDGVPGLSRAGAYVSGRIDSVASYFGYESVGGYVETDFSMVGSIDDPLIHALVWCRDMRYKQYFVDEAAGVLSFENNIVRWNDLRLRGKSTLVHSSGNLNIGGGEGKEKFGGDMALSVDAELYLARDGEAVTPAGQMNVSGAVRGDSIEASGRVKSASLELLDPWLPEKHRLKGTFSLNGAFAGTLANPGGRLNFQVTNPRYYGNRAFTLVGDALLTDSLLSAAAMLRMSEHSGAVELIASLPFLPSSGWKLDAGAVRAAQVWGHSKGLNVAELTGFLKPDLYVSGTASFNTYMRNAGDGWGLTGTLLLPDGYVRHVPENIYAHNVALNVSASGTLEKPLLAYTLASGVVETPSMRMESSVFRGRSVLDTLFVDSARLSFKQYSFIDLKGMMRYSGVDSLLYNQNFYALYTIRNFSTTMFSPFFPEYNLNKGVLNGSGLIYASKGRPLVDGLLYLNRLELTIPDITPVFGPLSATATLDGSVIRITAADAKWGRGVIHADGLASWDMEGIYGINLNLRANSLYFELPEVVQVGIENANMRVFSADKDINVHGKLALSPTTYMRDISIVETINQMQAGVNARRVPNPFLRSIQLRLDLDLANNMNVNMNLGSVSMDGRLAIAGTADEPGVVGEVKVTDGIIYYLDRKFKIVEGTLFNPDMTAINPTLNIVAKSDVTTYSSTAKAESFTITLSLLGTLENPVVRFTAEPALSELDILSILTFGERMGGMGSHTNDRLMSIAAQQALGLGARRLERYLNVDKISVGDVTGSGGSQSAGVTVGVTKRFSNRLNLTYETNTGNLTDRKVTAQYRLVPNLYLEGQTTSDGENAIDLIFRYSR